MLISDGVTKMVSESDNMCQQKCIVMALMSKAVLSTGIGIGIGIRPILGGIGIGKVCYTSASSVVGSYCIVYGSDTLKGCCQCHVVTYTHVLF